ncbi:aminoacyl-tRNA hydrolase [Georgenia sp. EYE_87]|uniref:alternative ribosome rescue aminoacyl-tRNA hydrolase ArfB n=1 Tax=Georgenia sp. EYE_87 TaxID=2853448 RepID=UPI002003F993|nr:alternative ribosome rescue aminoacyl-tRNA hydrolase ArfB [Georgenia sp. EYE_87]MCK6209120.1 aminoacyl-tRNA hydrolase [Georgenia sp. EYE_87]
MSDPVRVTSTVQLDPAELRWRFSRASGPGGQGVNTTDSRVELSFDVARSPALSDVQRSRVLDRLGGRLNAGVLTVVAAEHRSQLQNRRAALERLVEQLQEALAPPPRPRRPTRPSRGAVRRRTEAKQRRSSTKQLRRRPDR